MFGFWKLMKESKTNSGALRVAMIGESHRRDYLKHSLAGHIEVVGELVSDRRVELLTDVDPEVVILDCGSQGVNPLATLPRLAALAGSPRVVALTEISLTGTGEHVLIDLGADQVADIRDSSAIARALGLDEAHEVHALIAA